MIAGTGVAGILKNFVSDTLSIRQSGRSQARKRNLEIINVSTVFKPAFEVG